MVTKGLVQQLLLQVCQMIFKQVANTARLSIRLVARHLFSKNELHI